MTVATQQPTREAEALARRALARYGCSSRATLTFARQATNAIFRVDDPATGEVFALRLHGAGHHDRQQIKSELLWLDALRAHRCVEVPPPVGALDGDRVIELEDDDGPRLLSMSGWLEGEPLDVATDPARVFAQLGRAAAKLHAHTLDWRLPDGFCRPSWGPAQFRGASAGGHGEARFDAEGRRLLQAAEVRIADHLATLDPAAPDWTLLHAGLRPENVLVDRRAGSDVLRVIDFDDCGRGWLGYDAAVATSTLEYDSQLPAFLDAWVDGYRTIRPLSERQRGSLPTFVMARRLMLAGWFGPCRSAPVAGSGVADWTQETCEVAERYLGGKLGL